MTYNPNIPPPTTSPALSPVPIQTNYSQFAAIFSALTGGVFYNHIPLNNPNQGKHGAVIFENQSSDPSVTQDLDALYCKNTTSAASPSGQPQMFVRIPKFLPFGSDPEPAPNFPMQLTYNSVNTSGPNQYQSFLPGGFILYFGNTTTIGTPITLSPTPTEIVMVQAYSQGSAGGTANEPYTSGVNVTQPGTIQILSGNAPGGANFLWMAIAKA